MSLSMLHACASITIPVGHSAQGYEACLQYFCRGSGWQSLFYYLLNSRILRVEESSKDILHVISSDEDHGVLCLYRQYQMQNISKMQ